MNEQFTFYSDSGHGWLKVPFITLVVLGIKNKISSYSYVSNDSKNVYLEEDCDASIFIEAYKQKYGAINIAEKYIDGECFIRELPSYILKGA